MATLGEMIELKQREIRHSMLIKKTPTNLLNKSEAASFLHNEYWKYIGVHGYADQHPNFASIISENLRDANSPSAIESGHARGNRTIYGKLHWVTRINNSPMFSRIDLRNWFASNYVPSMLKAAA